MMSPRPGAPERGQKQWSWRRPATAFAALSGCLVLVALLLGGCPALPLAPGEPEVETIPARTRTATATAAAFALDAATPTAATTVATTAQPSKPPSTAPAPESPLAAPDASTQVSATLEMPASPPRVPLVFPTATPTETPEQAIVLEETATTPEAAAAGESYPSAATAEARLAIASMLTATVPVSVPMSAAMAAALTAVAPLPEAAEQIAHEPQQEAVETPAPPEADPDPTATPVPEPLPAAPPAMLAPDAVARTARVPILMYHYLSVPPANADIYRQDLSVAPDRFAEHLDRLRAEGYVTIRLYDLAANLLQGAPLPDKPVILTFDDGYRDNYENAFPLLRERGMTATFFVVSDFIDEQRPEYMTWDMAREMLAAGMSIEAHGRNHVSLAGKDDDYLVWQLLGTLETIQHELGQRPSFLSYPAGEYDDRTIAIARSADYWAAVTTRQGATHSSESLYELTRVRVRGTTTADDLIALLRVDW